MIDPDLFVGLNVTWITIILSVSILGLIVFFAVKAKQDQDYEKEFIEDMYKELEIERL